VTYAIMLFKQRNARKDLAWANAHNPFFVHGKHGKLGKFCRVAASTEGLALAKFLCDITGFTQLRRRRYGAPAARRHEAGFPFPSPKTQKVQKSSQK